MEGYYACVTGLYCFRFFGMDFSKLSKKKMLLDLLLSDKKLALSYAEEYLSEEYRGCKNYGYLSNDSNCSSMALYCITGYDAGQLEYIFPEESMLDGNPDCINKEWILNKWTEMITDCVDINNAEILV